MMPPPMKHGAAATLVASATAPSDAAAHETRCRRYIGGFRRGTQ